MTQISIKSWQDVQNEVRNRINSRIWKPGQQIPNEATLAQEFGCARATVNRGLQALADSGLLDRRRKAGTRVALHPVRKATLSIPILQHEIEARGLIYHYILKSRTLGPPPENIRAEMGIATGNALHIEALHLGDNLPYVIEDRWINITAVPQAETADFTQQSPNKWLVENAAFVSGDIEFSAENASPKQAELLMCKIDEALFVIKRRTQNHAQIITQATLIFAPHYSMKTRI